MIVAEWMTRDPVTLLVSATAGEAAGLMIRRKIRRLPIVAAPDGPLVGIISKGDIQGIAPSTLNPFSPGADSDPALQVPVRGIMTASPVTVPADAPLETAAQLMVERKIGGLPVVMGAQLVGILTESDLFRAFASALSSAKPGLRITFELGPGDDVVGMVVGLAARHKQRVVSVVTYLVEKRPMAVVRLVGPEAQQLVDELWKAGHRVRSILRLPGSSSS